MPAPQSSFRRRPESRGVGGGKTAASLGTKACPGLRSGIGGSRRTGLPLRRSGPRTRHAGPPIRHSGEGRNPGLAYGLQMTRKHLHQSAPRFSHLGVPAPAGMSDWPESMSRTPIRDESFPPRPLVSSCRRPLESPHTRHAGPPIRHSGEGRNPGLAYGLQMTRKHLHQSAPRFSHLGVPAPANGTKACPGLRSGMNRSRHDRWSRHAGVRWNPLALVMPAPQFVIPAKAGIQGWRMGCK